MLRQTSNPVAAAEGCDRAPARQTCILDRSDAPRSAVCDGCAADRRLRQRLQRWRGSCVLRQTPNPVAAAEGCDRALARQTCVPDRSDAPRSAVCDGCAADRRLRQRLQRGRGACVLRRTPNAKRQTPNPVAAAAGCDRALARQTCIPDQPDTPRSAVLRRLRRRSQAAPAATARAGFLRSSPNAEPCSRCRRLRSGASPPNLHAG